MKRLTMILGLLLGLFVSGAYTQTQTDCKNLVPDEITAKKIAEAVWLPLYGKAIYQKKPFVAKLVNGNVWKVTGTLKIQKGGVPYIEIQKCDGKILEVTHGK